MLISVVVPVYNEEQNIAPMLASLRQALSALDYEIVLVDDGSNDRTVQEAIAHSDPRLKLVTFSRNFGQTSALAAGIAEAGGEYIALIDGDLQNDPSDIPLMLEKLQSEGLDVVAGRRANRQDGMVLRKIPSKIANKVIRWSTGVYISDYGCTLKVFRADMAKQLELYGELHRFIPVLSHIHGGKIAEMDVRHHARRFGVSKYGIGRTIRVLSDLMLMLFFLKYRQKPMHLFGGLGIGMFLLGSAIEAYLLIQKLFGYAIAGRPLFYVGILLLITGVQLITTGFIAELIMRTYFESQNKKPYLIARRYRDGKDVTAG